MADDPLVLAETDAPAPCVIVVHEAFGLTPFIRQVCGRLAADGFHALAIDMYEGRVTDDIPEAMQWAAAMPMEHALAVVEAALGRVRADPRCTGKVFLLGFCLGGVVALQASCCLEDLAGVISFYGAPRPGTLDWRKRACPAQGHFGTRDIAISVPRVEAMAQAARVSGAPIDVYFYDAGHAFMRQTDPSVHVPEASAIAWPRVLGFLRST